jgi:hypothetical protein
MRDSIGEKVTKLPFDYSLSLQSLECQELDRAGVKQRQYKNSVYKIQNRDSPGTQPVYVVAEGATPLKTCYDVIKMDPKMSREYRTFCTINVNKDQHSIQSLNCYCAVLIEVSALNYEKHNSYFQIFLKFINMILYLHFIRLYETLSKTVMTVEIFAKLSTM